LPPDEPAAADKQLADAAFAALQQATVAVHRGMTWTTDAPYRETDQAIDAAYQQGVLAVEMEAAALYAFATARFCPVLCFAHVTNTMAVDGDDFEKGEADGSIDALTVVAAAAKGWRALMRKKARRVKAKA
jgi:uridine phosphorylase